MKNGVEHAMKDHEMKEDITPEMKQKNKRTNSQFLILFFKHGIVYL
jgi:hypothetical protein